MLNGVEQDFYLPVSTAQITIDRNSNNRRQGNITVELTPDGTYAATLCSTPAGLLSPFGAGAGATSPRNASAEVAISMSLVDQQTGNSGQVPLGLFTIAQSQLQDSGIDIVATLTVYDRSWVIQQRQLTNAYTFPATPSGALGDEVQAFLNPIWAQNPGAPPLQYSFSGYAPGTSTPIADWTVPSVVYDQGQDPWQAIMQLVAAAGGEVYFDVNGILVLKAMPDPTTQPVLWTFTDDSTTAVGLATGHLLSSQGLHGTGDFLSSPYTTPTACVVSLTREDIANDYYIAAVGAALPPTGVSASAITSQFQQEAFDNNPASPTYVRGPMGRVPSFLNSNLALSLAQAQAQAQFDLYNKGISAAWQVQVSAPPSPFSSINGTPDPTNPSRLTGGGVRAWDIDDVFMVYRPQLGLGGPNSQFPNGVKVVVDTIRLTVRYDDTIQLAGRVVSVPALDIGQTLSTISMDNTSDGGVLTGTPANLTWDHSVSASNFTSDGVTGHTVLLVGVFGGTASLGISSVTYGGVAMAQYTTTQVPGDRYIAVYYLFDPPAGDNNVVVTNNGSADALGGQSVSYLGTSGALSSPVTGTASTVSHFTQAFNTGLAESWAVVFAKNNDAGQAAMSPVLVANSTAQPNLVLSNTDGIGWLDSGSPVPTGPVVLGAQVPQTPNWAWIMFEMAPA